MLENLAPELIKEALASIDAEAAMKELLALPEKEFRPLFKQAWELAYKEDILTAVLKEVGDVRKTPGVPMPVFGSAQ